MLTAQMLTGLVLAGGQGRRMQALQSADGNQVDKGLLSLGGQPLVAWQVQQLQPWTSALLINANTNLSQYAQYGPVLADDHSLPTNGGPLIGLLTALRHCGTSWLLCVPVDSPFLPADFAPRLLQAQQQNDQALAFYCRADRDYPLCLLIHVQAQDTLGPYIAAGERRVMPWLHQLGAQAVDFPPQQADAFMNINTPEDLRAAQARLSWACS